MNCDQAAELIGGYLEGAVMREEADQLKNHLESCAECREMVEIWNQLALLPKAEPSQASRGRFRAMLAAYEEGQARSSAPAVRHENRLGFSSFADWGQTLAAGMVLAAALLLCGFFAGRYTANSDSHAQAELASMHGELTSMRQLVVLSLLQEQSATERLQGISWSTQESNADPQILAALLRTLRYDSSVDVRLAALDALSRHGNQPQVRLGLLDALQPQQSPLVQVAVIDLIVDLRDTQALDQLEKVQHDPRVNASVRERAQWAIRKLS